MTACDRPVESPTPEDNTVPKDIIPQISEFGYFATSGNTTERISCVEESFRGAILQAYLEIEPQELHSKIVEYHHELLSLHLYYDNSDKPTVIPATLGSAEEWDGLQGHPTIYVEFACDDLSEELYNGRVGAHGCYVISDGKNELRTAEFTIDVMRTRPLSNQLWYKTNNGMPIEFNEGKGPKVVSHEHAMWRYEVTFDDDLTTVIPAYFKDKSGVTEVIMPNSVTKIDNEAFNRCLDLESVNIPTGVTQLDQSVFNVTNLKRVYTDDLAAWCMIDFMGPIMFGNDLHYGELYVNNQRVKTIHIPESITKIKPYAFPFSNIEQVELHDSIESIAYFAFEHSGIKSITIPNSVTAIGDGAFNDCQSLESVVLPNNLSKLSKLMFNYCHQLKAIDIPQSITVIDDGALYMCESLSEIIVPDGVERVEGRAFAWCKNLESITFGSSVTEIGYSALAGCEKLESIYLRATTPPTLEPHLFQDPDEGVPDVTIYVPMESVDAYKSSESWSPYADRIEGYEL